MRDWKKVIIFLLVVVLGGALLYKTIWAADSDSFNITITVAYISIELKDHNDADYSTWAIGPVSGGAISTMDATTNGVKVSNESNVAIDLSSYASNTLGWTLGSSSGSDQYVLRVATFGSWQSSGPDMSSAITILTTSDPGTTVESNVTAITHRYWYYELTAPTSVSSPNQNTITVTVKATAH